MSTPFGTFVPQAIADSDEYKPIDHIHRGLIVKVLDYKPSIITPNSPDGGPGVICDMVDVVEAKAYRNVLWMSGSIVDNLKPHVGGNPVVIHFEPVTSKSGRIYPGVQAGTPAEVAAATAYFNANPNVFAQSLSTLPPPPVTTAQVQAVQAIAEQAAAPGPLPVPTPAAAPVQYTPELLASMVAAGMDITPFLPKA